MRDLLADYERLAARSRVGRGVVTGVWGSAPRREGAVLLANAAGEMAGSVSGGCVEAAVVEAIGRAMAEERPRLLEFAVSDERAWEVGLSCGGTLQVFVEPAVRPDVLEAARSGRDTVVPSVIAGPAALGAPSGGLLAALEPHARAALAGHASRSVVVPREGGEVTVFLEVMERAPTLLIIGAVHVAETLARLAKPLGYRVMVADARDRLLSPERFPDADELILGWPDEAFRRADLGPTSAVCILTHDPKFDEPAVELALATPAGYIGAIGSRKTQRARKEKFRARGYPDEQLARLRGPAGLDLGGRHPAEIALAILAEITAVRYGRSMEPVERP
jgi:xanthine dehydrogenase accessory factor